MRHDIVVEPYNLHEWVNAKAVGCSGRLFTCGRPGRGTYGTERVPIPDSVIDVWVHGLPSDDPLHIVSLLGHKPDGFSEFDYYQFRSQLDNGPKPTIQEWLATRSSRHVIIDEYPTIDRRGIPADVLAKARARITQLLAEGRSVVVVDSAGAERTARVCEAVGWRRDTDKGR